MHIKVYGVQPDEMEVYRRSEAEYGFTFEFAEGSLNENTVDETGKCDGIILLTTSRVTGTVAEKLAKQGVKYLATRSAGSDHIDYDSVVRYGMHCANVPFYAPGAIAEHTILMALSILRKSKRASHMVERGDFTLSGLRGRQLGELTAGVMGTGKIGRATARLLNGFGSNVLGWDPYPNEEAEKLCTYTTRDKLLRASDIIFLHCPLTPESYHMIDGEALEQMKEGAVLINTARGGLVDHAAVLRALKSGRLGGFAFDVYENEPAFLRKKISWNQIEDSVFSELLAREDTMYSAHMAFCTDSAIRNMIEVTLNNMKEYDDTGKCRNEIKRDSVSI